MKIFKRELSAVTVADLKKYPVWEFGNFSGESECELTPVEDIPCLDMMGRRVANQFRLADGSRCWGVLGGVAPNCPEFAEYLLSISLTKRGKWFHLSRPHQFNYGTSGPTQLAEFLKKPLNAIFPISFDISDFVLGHPDALRGSIKEKPSLDVTIEEIMQMTMRSH